MNKRRSFFPLKGQDEAEHKNDDMPCNVYLIAQSMKTIKEKYIFLDEIWLFREAYKKLFRCQGSAVLFLRQRFSSYFLENLS